MNGSVNTNSTSPLKKKKNGRFNFIDLTLIIILILVLGTLIYSFSPVSLIRKWTNKDIRNIQYEVEFNNVDKAFIDMIQADDVVINSVTKDSIGTVTMVNPDKYVEYKPVKTERVEGEETITEYTVIPVEYPNKYTVRVTITVSANFSEGTGYSVNATRIAVGEKMALKFPNFKCEGYCVGITEY